MGLLFRPSIGNTEDLGGRTRKPRGDSGKYNRTVYLLVGNGETLPAHPTQLYEAGCYFILFAVLMWMYWKRNAEERPWLITGVFFIGIFLPRFLIEYIKNNQVESEYNLIAQSGMNLGQMLSIPFILLGVFLVIWALVHPRQHWDFPNRFAPEDSSSKASRK